MAQAEMMEVDGAYPAQKINVEGNFYDVLGLARVGVTESAIKKAYFKLSLQVHPDRNKGHEEEATKKFQALGRIYATLSDKERRKVYDETGEVDDGNDPESFEAWQTFWRARFRKVTLDDIKAFERQYKDSEEEKNDVLEAYKSSKGDMDEIMDTVMLAMQEDEPRFRKFISAAIKKGEVKAYPAFSKETSSKRAARKKRFDAEAAEAEEAAGELGLGPDGPTAIIKSRAQAEFEAMTAALEAKYGAAAKKPKARKGKRAPDMGEPSEEEFARIQAEMDARKNSKPRKA